MANMQREIILPSKGDTVEIVALYKENKNVVFKAISLGDNHYWMKNFLAQENEVEEPLKATFKITKDVMRSMNSTRMVLIEKKRKW